MGPTTFERLSERQRGACVYVCVYACRDREIDFGQVVQETPLLQCGLLARVEGV